jgi:hypothetical protein
MCCPSERLKGRARLRAVERLEGIEGAASRIVHHAERLQEALRGAGETIRPDHAEALEVLENMRQAASSLSSSVPPLRSLL